MSYQTQKLQAEMTRRLRESGMSSADSDEFGLFLALCVAKRPLDEVALKHSALFLGVANIQRRYGIDGDGLQRWVYAARAAARSVR